MSASAPPAPPSNAPPAADWEALLAPPEEREATLHTRLKVLGISWKSFTHDPVYTVEEARNLRGAIAGTHTKNLFLEDRRGGLWLVVAREELRLDLNATSKMLGAPRFSFGKPETMVKTLGVSPGAVTPFALMNDKAGQVACVLDAELTRREILNFHPLRNDRTLSITAAGLLRFLADCGHPPRLATLPERLE